MKQAQHFRKAIGVRRTDAATHHLHAHDETLAGTFWFDLQQRSPAAARMKRAIDVAGSLVLIVLLAPLMLAVVLLIKLTSKGPAVFVQRRIGFRGHEFGMYKFRSMIVNAEELQDQFVDEGAMYFKVIDDPRVTKIGRYLRRSSIDELPQLFNVLRGNMSLVGPRPLLIADLHRFPRRAQMRRFSMLPGITGLWQVSGRSATTDEERMRLDREYVNHWSLGLDLKILLKTIGAVLSGRGAV